jgi:hypothetical protein
MHPSRIEPKSSWKHIKVLTTKPLQTFINKDEKSLSLLCLAWNCLKNSKFNVHFLLRNNSNVTNEKMILKLIFNNLF